MAGAPRNRHHGGAPADQGQSSTESGKVGQSIGAAVDAGELIDRQRKHSSTSKGKKGKGKVASEWGRSRPDIGGRLDAMVAWRCQPSMACGAHTLAAVPKPVQTALLEGRPLMWRSEADKVLAQELASWLNLNGVPRSCKDFTCWSQEFSKQLHKLHSASDLNMGSL
eukprot:6323973-Amphidinium_carterae.2